MNRELRQARKGQSRLVKEDSQLFSINMSTDATDPWAESDDTKFKGRISHKESSVPTADASTTGVDYDLRHMLSVEHFVDFLVEGDIITDESGAEWELGRPDPLRRFGGIYGYQVNLIERS